MSDYDVIVVGLGAIGSATAWQLARRGRTVLGLERFELGHARGASHGDSRIIRQSYHAPSYVRSAARAYRGWSQLEAESGHRLLTICGGVDVFPAGTATDERDYTTSMDAAGVRYRSLTAKSAAARWPGLRLPAGASVLQQDRTGIVAAGPALAQLHRQARRHGAELRERTEVTAVEEEGCGVTVRAGTERYRAGHVVLAVDGWTNRLLDTPLRLVTNQEFVRHYAVEHGSHRPGDFPVWIWMDDPSYYGFPSFAADHAPGPDSVKVGQDCGGRPQDPDQPRAPDQEYLDRMDRFVAQAIPGAGPVLRTTSCLYTLTPDRDFVLGPAPGRDRTMVALGAAHGFKFAPWFGAGLADLITQGGTDLEVEAFAADRKALL